MAELTTEALSASDIESLVNALPEYLAETKCPNCSSSDASMYHRVEGIKTVKFCSSCDTLFGIDDSMNMNDLRRLMEEGNVRFKTADSCACGNDDVDAFLIEQCQQSGKLYLKCMKCNLTKDIEIISSDVDVMPEDTEDRVVEDDRLVGDNGTSSACHTFEDQIPHQPFACECGNEENELFEKVFDASGNSLVSVRCWNCDRQTKLWTNWENYCLIECAQCGNNMEDLFDKTINKRGKIVGIFCQVCETHLQLKESMKTSQQSYSSESYEPPIFVSYNETKVTSLRFLKGGDHVAWKRGRGIYSHHGIVVEVLSENELKVIHNTTVEGGKAANGGARCKILKGNVEVDITKGDLYLCNYKPGDCLEPDEVIARAESLVDEKNYNLFKSNCEHFATLCKTAKSFSNQVTSFIIDAVGGLGSVAVKVGQDGVYAGMASKVGKLAADKVLRCSFKGAIRRLTASGLSGGTKALSIGGPVGITFAMEGIVFGTQTYRAFKEYKEGVINWEEFRAKTADAGCFSGIRFVCSSTGGVIGQILIPVPFLGGFVGCTIGTFVGYCIGKIVGKLSAEAVLAKETTLNEGQTTSEA